MSHCIINPLTKYASLNSVRIRMKDSQDFDFRIKILTEKEIQRYIIWIHTHLLFQVIYKNLYLNNINKLSLIFNKKPIKNHFL